MYICNYREYIKNLPKKGIFWYVSFVLLLINSIYAQQTQFTMSHKVSDPS